MRPSSWAILVVLAAGLSGPAPLRAADSLGISELGGHTHIHGLAVDRTDPQQLLIATHHGLFRAGPDGTARRVSVVQDFMGFNPHPSDPDTLYASGHPATGGNLGFIASTDRGATWQQISPGADGPVDFHQMSVSPADPRTIYGVYGDLQISTDAGRTWKLVGPVPDRLIGLAASVKDRNRIYAATEAGLARSDDGGRSWESLIDGPPATMVAVTPDGALYAFVLGQGLVRSDEVPLDFRIVSGDWGDGYVLHLAVDPADPERMFAAMQDSSILASTDGGRSWTSFGR